MRLLLLILLGMVCGCEGLNRSPAEEYWDSLRSHSLTLTEQFLTAAAVGDSAALSRLGSAEAVSRVLEMQDDYRTSMFSAAAAGASRDRRATVHGYGALVQFQYDQEGRSRTGVAEIGYEHRRLVVISVSLMANID